MASVVMRVLCLVACLSVGLGSARDMKSGMHQALTNLFPHYKADNHGITGSQVFSLDFPRNSSIEDHVKKVLMVGVLEGYEKMIGQMLDQRSSVQEGEAEIRQNLSYMQNEVKDLLEYKYHESSLLKKELLKLENIKTNSTEIQAKALHEFYRLYQEAAKLVGIDY